MNMFMKFIIIIMLGFASASEYIKMERKWVEREYVMGDYHGKCQEQYDKYRDTCPPGWVVKHEYLNVAAGAAYGRTYIALLNCELVVLCKVQTSKYSKLR